MITLCPVIIAGVNELLVEWRRPEISYDSIKFYTIHLKSIDGQSESRDLRVDVMNETLRYVVIKAILIKTLLG